MEKKTEPSGLRKKLDRFWSVLFLTPEGKPKSTTLLYSFCLNLLFTGVNIAAYLLLIDPIHNWLVLYPVWDMVAECLIPGLLATGLCSLLLLTRMDKRLVPIAYLWMLLFALASMIAMALLLNNAEAFSNFFKVFAQFVFPALISGLIISQLVFWRRKRRESEDSARNA